MSFFERVQVRKSNWPFFNVFLNLQLITWFGFKLVIRLKRQVGY